MTGFKVGDRVRYVKDGDEGVVTEVSGNWINVDFEVDGLSPVTPEEISLVTDTAARNFAKTAAKFATDLLSTEDIEALTTLGEQLGISSFESNVRRITGRIADMLIQKNKSYSNAALDPINVFSKADRTDQIRTRIDDKLNRIRNGHEYPGDDTVNDLIGYLIIYKIAEESA